MQLHVSAYMHKGMCSYEASRVRRRRLLSSQLTARMHLFGNLATIRRLAIKHWYALPAAEFMQEKETIKRHDSDRSNLLELNEGMRIILSRGLSGLSGRQG